MDQIHSHIIHDVFAHGFVNLLQGIMTNDSLTTVMLLMFSQGSTWNYLKKKDSKTTAAKKSQHPPLSCVRISKSHNQMKDDSVAVCKLCGHVLYSMLEWSNSAPAVLSTKHFPSSFYRRCLTNEGRLKSDFFLFVLFMPRTRCVQPSMCTSAL